jgi:hypothetical protein
MLAAAAIVWITLDANTATPPASIGRGWTIAGTADAAFQPLFVYPDYRSGLATTGGFRIARAVNARTMFTLDGRAGATYVDSWRPFFEGDASISWRASLTFGAGLRHDGRLRREGPLMDFRDPTGRIVMGATALPFRHARFAAGVAVEYERALPGAQRLPSRVSASITARLNLAP